MVYTHPHEIMRRELWMKVVLVELAKTGAFSTSGADCVLSKFDEKFPAPWAEDDEEQT